MEHYGLYNSPSFIASPGHDSDSSNSEEDSYILYKNMQRIPNVLLPDSKSKTKRLFTRRTPIKQHKNLHDFLMQLKDPIVSSTPLAEPQVNTIEGSTISILSPIKAKRNSVIHVNPHKSPNLSNNTSENHTIRWAIKHLKTLKRIKRKKLKRKGQKKAKKQNPKASAILVKTTSTADNLDGIEPLSNEGTLVGNPKGQVVEEKETQTSYPSFYKDNVGKNNQNEMSNKMRNLANHIDFLKQKLSTSRNLSNPCTNVNQNEQCTRSPFKRINSARKILTKIDLFSSSKVSTTPVNKTNNNNLISEDKECNATTTNITNNNKENLESGKKITISDRTLRSQTRSQNTFRCPEVCVQEKPKQKGRKNKKSEIRNSSNRIDLKMGEVSACNQTQHSECSEAKVSSTLDATESIRNSTNVNYEGRRTRQMSRLLNKNSNLLNNTEILHINSKCAIETKNNETALSTLTAIAEELPATMINKSKCAIETKNNETALSTLTAIAEKLPGTMINKTQSITKKSGIKRKSKPVNNLTTVEVESIKEKTELSFDEKQKGQLKVVVELERWEGTNPSIQEPNATDVRHSKFRELEKDCKINNVECIELSSEEKSCSDIDAIIQEIDNVQEFSVVKSNSHDGIQSDMSDSVFVKPNPKVQTRRITRRRVISQNLMNHDERGEEKVCVAGGESGNDGNVIKEPPICERSIEVNSEKVSYTQSKKSPVHGIEFNLQKEVETQVMNTRKRVIDQSLSNYGKTDETCSKKSCVEEKKDGNNLNGNVQVNGMKEVKTPFKKSSVFETRPSKSDSNEVYYLKGFGEREGEQVQTLLSDGNELSLNSNTRDFGATKTNKVNNLEAEKGDVDVGKANVTINAKDNVSTAEANMQFSESCNHREAHCSKTSIDLNVTNVHPYKRIGNKRLRGNETNEPSASTCSSKRKTNALSKQNITNRNSCVVSDQYTYSYQTGFVRVEEAQLSINTNSTISDTGRPKRVTKPPAAFIQVAYLNSKQKRKSSTKSQSSGRISKNITRKTNKQEEKTSSENAINNVTKKTKKASTNSRKKQSNNNNTSIRNMEVSTNGTDQHILSHSTQADNHLPTTSEHLAQDNHESGLDTGPLSTSAESTLVLKQNNTEITKRAKALFLQNLTLIENKVDLDKQNGGDTSRGSLKKNCSEEDQPVAFTNNAGITKHQQIHPGECIVEPEISNKTIPLVTSSENTINNVTKKTNKASTKTNRKKQSSNNNNTSAIRDLEVITNGADRHMLSKSTQTDDLPSTSKHLGQDNHESSGLGTAPLSTSTESTLVQKQNNTKIMKGSKVVVLQNLTLIENKIDSDKHNGGESSKGSSKKDNFEEDQPVVFKNNADIPKHQQIRSEERIIQAVIGNKTIPLDWWAEAPQFDKPQNLSVIYCLTNLKSHLCVFSSGFVVFAPGEEKTQIPKHYIIAYKVDRGHVSVTQHFVTQTFGVNSTFYIPLGSPYILKNISDTEYLILFFTKMSNDSSVN